MVNLADSLNMVAAAGVLEEMLVQSGEVLAQSLVLVAAVEAEVELRAGRLAVPGENTPKEEAH